MARRPAPAAPVSPDVELEIHESELEDLPRGVPRRRGWSGTAFVVLATCAVAVGMVETVPATPFLHAKAPLNAAALRARAAVEPLVFRAETMIAGASSWRAPRSPRLRRRRTSLPRRRSSWRTRLPRHPP